MSYDLRLAVKAEGAEDCYVVFDEPEYSSPTYNIGDMFRACTGWNFKQSEWYNAKEVLPLIQHGINELKYNEKEYIKYNSPNGWGSTESALKALQSLEDCIYQNVSGNYTWNKIPIECIYISW